MSVGKILKKLRGNRTRLEVAKSIDITVSALSNYENDYRVPKDEVKKKLAIYYNKTVDEIFFNN